MINIRRGYFWMLVALICFVILFAVIVAWIGGPKEFSPYQLVVALCGSVVAGLLAPLIILPFLGPASVFPEKIVEEFYDDWLNDAPLDDFPSLFSNADVVQICAVTFYNTIFGSYWFAGAMEKRIDQQSRTNIMLLQPEGHEIKRRAREGRPTDEPGRLRDRCIKSNEIFDQILEGREGAQDYRRNFDYSPSVNYLRFGDTAFVVLLMHEKGGHSPGFRLKRGTWLFGVYERHFDGMWTTSNRELLEPIQ